MTFTLVPFATDPTESAALAEEALRVRLAPGEDLRDLLPGVIASIQAARANGGLLRCDGETRGVALWEPAGPVGVSLRLLYLEPKNADPAAYRETLSAVEHAAGPIAFAPGPLAGLTEEEESSVLRTRGFAPFGRSEMTFPPGAPVPPVVLPVGGAVRAVGPSDQAALARLHERAYRNHLDRFLALEDLDPTRDADRQLRDYFTGRYGEFLPTGSRLVTVDGTPAAAVLAVRRPAHVLIIDVMTDPPWQGRGLGRAALASALAGLRSGGEGVVVLNVTEGNTPALRLYGSVGFVRSLGPTKEWYDARRMAVEFPPADRR